MFISVPGEATKKITENIVKKKKKKTNKVIKMVDQKIIHLTQN